MVVLLAGFWADEVERKDASEWRDDVLLTKVMLDWRLDVLPSDSLTSELEPWDAVLAVDRQRCNGAGRRAGAGAFS